MNTRKVARLYNDYLTDIAEMNKKRFSRSYEHCRGLIHGLGISLGLDYETVERDIARATGHEYEYGILTDIMPGQLQLAL